MTLTLMMMMMMILTRMTHESACALLHIRAGAATVVGTKHCEVSPVDVDLLCSALYITLQVGVFIVIVNSPKIKRAEPTLVF